MEVPAFVSSSPAIFSMPSPPKLSCSQDEALANDITAQVRVPGTESSTSEDQGLIHITRTTILSQIGCQSKRTRKSYSKSRRGCLNCKNARLKCKENHPSCDYCSNRGLRCRWPEINIVQVRNAAPSLFPPQYLSAAISLKHPVSGALDLRLFDHFIKSSYPHQPMNNDSIWTHEIPSISSQYDFLLHSMLALSASDLVASTPSDSSLICKAIAHRVKSISSLNAAIASGITSFEQGNAMLATCFVLVFQSTLINDGLVEYMTFIRGCVVVGMQMGMRRMKFLFHSLWGDDSVRGIDDGLKAMPLLDSEAVGKACRSLENIGSLCRSKGELGIYVVLLGTARALFTSSRDAYMELRKIYASFSYTMSHEDFRSFTTPANEVGKLLMAHFVALQLIMTRIAKAETAGQPPRVRAASSLGPPSGTTVSWLGDIHSKIGPEFVKYYAWTMFVEREVHEGRIVS